MLWAGSWKTGSITVSGSSAYRLFILTATTSNSIAYTDQYVLAFKTPGNDAMRCFNVGVWGMDNGEYMSAMAIEFSVSGDTFTWTNTAARRNLGNGFQNPFGQVKAIYGVI